MTVAELIDLLVRVNHHEYTVDVRVTPGEYPPDPDYEDRDVLGIVSVIESREPGPFAARGWVTLELES